MEKSFLFILSKAPYSTSSARESTDAIMATCAFGQTVSILALEDAVYQFSKKQSAKAIEQKDTAAMLESLPLYGTEEFIALESDLKDRNLTPDSFVIPVKVISSNDINTLINNADVVLSY